MSRNARVVEVTTDDEMDSDPSDMDPTEFDPNDTIMRASDIPTSSNTSRPVAPQQLQAQQLPIRSGQTAEARALDKERTKDYQCLYPIYFDKSRSRAQGRRVSAGLAVEDPLAYSIVKAAYSLGLQNSDIAFEPVKTHPKDWANPGRVRVNFKNARFHNAKSAQLSDKNKKRYLYILIAKWLRENPTTKESQLECQMRGMPVPEDKYLVPAIPKGYKMGSILPLHSPALSGGGVNENFLKDMAEEMKNGGGPGGMGGMLPPGLMDMMGGGGPAPASRTVSGPKPKKGKK